jgi:hypothetical protein
VNQLFVNGRPQSGLAGETQRADQITPDFKSPGAKTMKKLQPIVCTGILVLAVSGAALAKPGTISTTKAGIISTTRTGIIPTTAAGAISTTHTGPISTTNTNSIAGFDRFSFVALLLSVFGQW